MKKLNTLFFIFLMFTTCSYSQTEKETIDFINSKLAIHTLPLKTVMRDIPTYIVVKTEVERQTQRKHIVIETYHDQELEVIEKFLPENISGIGTFRAEMGHLCIEVISNKRLIRKKYTGSLRDLGESRETIARLVISTSDEEVYRIKKAFEHLLKLNGVEQPNDNLFRD